MQPFEVAAWLAGGAAAAPVAITKPVQLTCWSKLSKTQGGEIMLGEEAGLAEYRAPEVPANLNEGYPDDYTPKGEGGESPVEPVVHAAAQSNVDWASVDVVTYRNNLNKVLGTLISPSDHWIIDAVRIGRTLFLDIVKTPSTWSNPKAELFTFYGYKFEALCTGSSHVDATSEFAIVVTYRLGSRSIVMAAEVDAEKPGGADGPLNGRSYVELKTYTLPRHAKAVADMYVSRHAKWWVQSFLAGIPTLVLGGRDTSGTLVKVHEVAVQHLPGLSSHAGHPWAAPPEQLLAFGDAVLGWMSQAAGAAQGKQLRFSYVPEGRRIDVDLVADGALPGRMQAAMAAG